MRPKLWSVSSETFGLKELVRVGEPSDCLEVGEVPPGAGLVGEATLYLVGEKSASSGSPDPVAVSIGTYKNCLPVGPIFRLLTTRVSI